MKNSEIKAVAEALSRTQDMIDSICEVMDDEGDESNMQLYIKIPRIRDATYEVVSEKCGVQIFYLSNNHIKEKLVKFRTNSKNQRHKFCLQVAFEFLDKLIPWCDLMISSR